MSLVFDFGQGLRCCNVVFTLDTAAVTELWQLDLFSCYFFAGGLVGVDKHLFQRVPFITSMTLPLNYIFVLLLANVDVISKQKQLSTV